MVTDVCSIVNKRLQTKLLILFVIVLSSCSGRKCGSNGEDNAISNITIVESPSYYHFMVENSGSMKGYFKGNSRVKEILKNLYDRLDEQLNVDSGDTITLNYINTEIVSFNGGIEPFLQQIWSKCTASFTKLDDILSMAFAEAKSESVTILVSDYCFASNVGNLETAKSGITNLLTNVVAIDCAAPLSPRTLPKIPPKNTVGKTAVIIPHRPPISHTPVAAFCSTAPIYRLVNDSVGFIPFVTATITPQRGAR